jgi:hypothetical protein
VVKRGALFGWMVLGGVVGAVAGEAFLALIYPPSIAFNWIVAALTLIIVVPLSVIVTSVVFGCTLLVRSQGRERVVPSIVASLGGAAIVLTIALLLVDWLRWPQTWFPLACAAILAIGGGFVARARAARPRYNSWWSEG